jgi:hypothetical protein
MQINVVFTWIELIFNAFVKGLFQSGHLIILVLKFKDQKVAPALVMRVQLVRCHVLYLVQC